MAFALFSMCLIAAIFYSFSRDLPDYQQLLNYKPATISRIYSSEGYIISELAKENRIFYKINEIPEVVINAFIAAEDRNYYDHPGFDISSIFRASIQNLLNLTNDKSPVGGSTITQQVVKNFLLTNERSISRKVKEAILAYRINQVLSKEKILELYLNQIYLGNRSYGIVAASLSYFDKDISKLTLEEAALLASLPKAPSLLDPTRNAKRVKSRRDWVLNGMYEANFITLDQKQQAQDAPIKVITKNISDYDNNGYFVEAVKLELQEKYGYAKIYEGGVSVYTSLNMHLQKYADQALREGLIDYDKRYGYRGPITSITFDKSDWVQSLSQIDEPAAIGNWQIALVTDVASDKAVIGLKTGAKSTVRFETSKWARKRMNNLKMGKKVLGMSEILKQGDVILVNKVDDKDSYTLEQIPQVNGAIIAIQPKTGNIIAMSGGYSFKQSKYNRVTQAYRQPGSTFKAFVYLTALQKGYSAMSILKDEPITISQGKTSWTPKNFEGKFLGDITLRKSLEKSRNLATVDLITKIGAEPVGLTAANLGVYSKVPPAYYSMALGAFETTLLKLTNAFAIFANDGKYVKSNMISRIENHDQEKIYKASNRECVNCFIEQNESSSNFNINPIIEYEAEQVIDPLINYQLVSMLEGVVNRGTAVRARSLGKTIAAKTGTSNESYDTWCIGFTPDIAVGVFVGYDTPKTLGAREQGSTVALPIFIKFMNSALKNIPNKAFTVPDGIKFISVDYDTGKPINSANEARIIISEPLKLSDMPTEPDEMVILDDSNTH